MTKVIYVDDSNWYDGFAKRGPELVQRLGNHVAKPLRWKPINEFFYAGASTEFEDIALFSLKVEKDLVKAKQYLYYSELCKVRHYLEFAKGATSVMDAAMATFFKTPLSGSSHLYSFFAALRVPHQKSDTKSKVLIMRRHYATLQQAAMIKDRVWLAKELESFENACKNEPSVDNTNITGFYQAIVDNDADGVEKALMAQLDPKEIKKRSKNYGQTIPGRFMAWLTMWCAKVAWINGYEIEIDHPFIISELLPDTQPSPTTTIESNPYPFLIDPVLENFDFWHYGGEQSDEEVQAHNQAIFQTRIPAKYDGVENFVKLPPDE